MPGHTKISLYLNRNNHIVDSEVDLIGIKAISLSSVGSRVIHDFILVNKISSMETIPELEEMSCKKC